ncbi:MAG: hypothetical protein ACLRI8_01250 [Agathobacter rectalis]
MELFYDFNGFQLLFPALFWLFGGVWGAVLGISAISATFSCSFPAFGRVWDAVWGISAVSATFPAFKLLAGFGVLFGISRFQLHKARLLCYQPMAIVHYDNLKSSIF